MAWFIQRLLVTLAASSDSELRQQVQFLKVENEILQSKLTKRISLTPGERARLVKLGTPLGASIKDLITIVTPTTFARWARQGPPSKRRKATRRPGRPRRPDQIRELVLRIARETGWGYTRILGELKKLGINTICRSTVVNILREHGLDPGPKRGEKTWDEFLTMHAKTLWACDFLPQGVLTWRGWRDAYILVVINVLTRRAWISPSSLNPTRSWTSRQIKRFCDEHKGDPNAPTIMIHGRDTKFYGEFQTALRSRGVLPLATQFRSPNMNAYAERFIQTLEHECLDHFIVLGRRHLDYLVGEFLVHYHTERPYQSVANLQLIRAGPSLSATKSGRTRYRMPRSARRIAAELLTQGRMRTSVSPVSVKLQLPPTPRLDGSIIRGSSRGQCSHRQIWAGRRCGAKGEG